MSDYTSWARLLGADPVPGLLTSTEPAARWVARTAVLDQPADAPEVLAASAAVRADHGTEILIARLPTGRPEAGCQVITTPGSRRTC